MNKKVFFLLIGCVLMASVGLYAQSSEFIIEDEEVVVVVPPKDTVVEQVKQIPVTQRTWENLEQTLKDNVISLSKNYANKKVSKSDIVWIYEICNVPTTTGNKTIYLSMLATGGYIISKQNPNTLEEVCECFLDLEQPQRVVVGPSKHQTDDEHFGKPNVTGNNRKLQTIDF